MHSSVQSRVQGGRLEPETLWLSGSRDKRTGRGVFPEVPETSPARPLYETITLSETASVYSFTVIHPNPKTGHPPFFLIYADFPEEVRVFGRLELPNGERPRIGMTVRAVAPSPSDEGAGAEEYVFVPADEVTR
ncbi:Zn-ribbon domain-containing OB-fold protein [Methylobacterium nodulans]|uniref:ChsH2 C-terminal OB-fold domain-containing protein n=1 Tax=Methylobacterium nodulans (strain LMG 21967 / CNCM I-2342 / ORS 2060) TaxID=460265 RepID=B8INM9_METNO|nr:OB-fold domain-containing protein [Methylobacterium nodulans]ACL58395.1 protein of unknown function DUF35 [Methylobacterium nodulans ORS 2060]